MSLSSHLWSATPRKQWSVCKREVLHPQEDEAPPLTDFALGTAATGAHKAGYHNPTGAWPALPTETIISPCSGHKEDISHISKTLPQWHLKGMKRTCPMKSRSCWSPENWDSFPPFPPPLFLKAAVCYCLTGWQTWFSVLLLRPNAGRKHKLLTKITTPWVTCREKMWVISSSKAVLGVDYWHPQQDSHGRRRLSREPVTGGYVPHKLVK